MNTQLQTKKDLHIARKLWHVCGVGLLILAYVKVPYPMLLVLGSLFTILVVATDLLRLYSPKLNSTVQKLFWFCMREGEKNSLSGMSFLALGALILAAFFPKEIVLLSLIFLGLADPIASTFGVLYGKNKIGTKSLEGSIAAFVTCTLASLVFYLASGFFNYRIFLLVPLSGLLGALSELVQIKYVDDNFSFPILAAFGLLGLSYLLGA